MGAKPANISFPEDLLQAIDKYAANLKRSRSSIVEEVLRLGLPGFALANNREAKPSQAQGIKVTASTPVPGARRTGKPRQPPKEVANNRTSAIIPALDLSRFRSFPQHP
jgi:hypothetical protein